MGDLERAFATHQSGDLQGADLLCRRVLENRPRDVEALHLRGVIAIQSGDCERAVELLKRALGYASEAPHIHNNLGEAYRQSGQLDLAESTFTTAVDLDPENADALGNLGVVLRQQGRVEEAVTRFREALSQKPDHAEAAMNLGTSLRDLGQLQEAADVFQRTMQQRPAFSAARVRYGLCLMELGRTTAALEVLNEALRRAPDDPQVLLALGDVYLAQADLPAATYQIEQAILADPQGPDNHYRLADVYFMQDRLLDAEKSLRSALAIEPASPEFLELLGWILRDQGRLDESMSVIESALELAPNSVSARNNLARTMRELGDANGALEQLSKSLQLDPSRADTHNYIGKCLIALGDSEQAVEHFRKSISLDPGFVMAWENLARARKFGNEDREEIARLEKVVEKRGLMDAMKASLHFALGKIEDDCGEYDRAFAHYRDANTIKAKTMVFDADLHRDLTTRKIEALDSRLFEAKKGMGNDSDVPVFIVGMLRSGTTLVEQILSSHRQIHGAGELSVMNSVRVSGPGSEDSPDDHIAALESLTPDNIRELAEGYLIQLTRDAGDSLRVTDKMPHNYLHLALIAILFPGARVIHCRRNPMDNCLSIYFQHLDFHNPYACDLKAIGQWYHEYQRLMEHWKKVLPVRIHELDYEQLVADQESTTKAMVEFCGLEWDPSCLEFQRNRRVVLTASDWQVRQTLYSGSVERWKNYRKHLVPLEQALAGSLH